MSATRGPPPGRTCQSARSLPSPGRRRLSRSRRRWLDKQRGLDHRNAMRIAPLDLRHPAVLALHDLRMHDGVQLINASGKDQVRQLAPIDGPIFIEDFTAEAANNFDIGDRDRK